IVSFSMDKLLPSLFPFSFSSFSPLLSPFQLHHFLFHFQLTPHFQLSHPPYQHHHFFQLTSSSFSTTSSSTTTSSSFSTTFFFLSTTFLFSSHTLPLLVVMALQCSLGFVCVVGENDVEALCLESCLASCPT